MLATGTASGKSLCYQLPIVEGALNGSTDTALLIFPTKALAQDQLRALQSWLVPGVRAATYDGDTPTDTRVATRKHANVVLTNPEMLHVGILPAHERWATFFMRLRYVVVDELHMLRGVFGSHVADVLRRLRRVCADYGSQPSFCFTSATIGNPGPLASALCGLDVTEIDNDGAPRAERGFVCWQRPLLDAATGTRRSANAETADVLARFVRAWASESCIHPQPQRCGAGGRAGTRCACSRFGRRDGSRRCRVPSRLPRGRAAHARSRVGNGRACRGGRDQRAGAGDRCGRSRRRGLQRLPRHARVVVAAGRTGRPGRPALGCGARRR